MAKDMKDCICGISMVLSPFIFAVLIVYVEVLIGTTNLSLLIGIVVAGTLVRFVLKGESDTAIEILKFIGSIGFMLALEFIVAGILIFFSAISESVSYGTAHGIWVVVFLIVMAFNVAVGVSIGKGRRAN